MERSSRLRLGLEHVWTDAFNRQNRTTGVSEITPNRTVRDQLRANRNAICPTGHPIINVMLKEVIKNKSLQLNQIFWETTHDPRAQAEQLRFLAP
jgi:hypothetical protein